MDRISGLLFCVLIKNVHIWHIDCYYSIRLPTRGQTLSLTFDVAVSVVTGFKPMASFFLSSSSVCVAFMCVARMDFAEIICVFKTICEMVRHPKYLLWELRILLIINILLWDIDSVFWCQ